MREYLFRGKRLEKDRCGFADIDWVEGSLIDSGNHEQVAIFPWVKGASTMGLRQLVHFRMVGVDPVTVGRCTGLPDKNGRKIYEGDIVRVVGHESYVNGLYIVVYSESNHCWWLQNVCPYIEGFSFDELNGFHTDGEVIGNIHDNSELLEENRV